MRRVLGVDGNKTCGGGPKQWRIRASHLRVRRVRPYANLQRSRGKQVMGKEATMPRDLRPEEFRVVPDRHTWQIHRTGRELSVSESKGQYGSWEGRRKRTIPEENS